MRFIVVLLLLCVPAIAQHHDHPQDLDLHNKFYSNWLVPNPYGPRVSSCCSKNDCYPTAVIVRNGQYYARRREDGAWLRVPPERLEQNQPDPRESPDHQSHACIAPPHAGNYVYCATLGAGG